MKLIGTIWPPIEQAFTDECGPIDREVYDAAATLWPRAERLALQTLRDAATGQHLMMKACALVTRQRLTAPAEISNLSGYLFRTWKRLLLAELEKENGHRRHEAALVESAMLQRDDASDDLDHQILLQQLMRRMDPWTRRVFQLRALGFTFEEIGPALGLNSHITRTRFSKRLKRLAAQLAAENKL
jgi:DNA-directed RNA polymerase specialized sigma24 family protein